MNDKPNKQYEQRLIVVLVLLLLALCAANLWFGSVQIPASVVWDILCGKEPEKEVWKFIVLESRLPQMVAALLSGAALAVAGLLLQTAFNNPLAGPSILGIDTGASLGVALVMLFGEAHSACPKRPPSPDSPPSLPELFSVQSQY